MRSKLIQILKENWNKYTSGQELSNKLGVSRTAVWKHIKVLNEKGYKIETKHKSGYKLLKVPINIDIDKLREMLADNTFISKIEYMETVESTNKVLKGMDNLTEGYILIADRQTKGKGRLNRHWESPFGKGIWMSILLKPNIPPAQLPLITLIAGFSVATAIGEMYNLPAEIKWPNDIIIRGKKVCGILTELSGEMERIESVVVGIGINANQGKEDFPPELKEKATSISLELGQQIDREKLIKKLLEYFFNIYNNGNYNKNFIELYTKKCITLNKEVKVITPFETYVGIAKYIKPSGSLIVLTDNGEKEVTAGDVSIRSLNGYV